MADTTTTTAPETQETTQELAPPITSRFLFVDVAAQRAKQLRRGALPRIERANAHKLERVAMDEVRAGLIPYTLPTGYEGSPKGLQQE